MMQSNDRDALWQHAVAGGGGLSPNPRSSKVVVVEDAPQIVLARRGLSPVPSLLDLEVGPVHVLHVPAVGELRELGVGTERSLAETVSRFVAIDLQPADGVGDGEDTAGPALVEGLVGVVVGGEVGVVAVVGAVEGAGVHDAEHGEFLGAGGVAELGVAAVAGHAADPAVLLLRPDGGLEGESLLGGDALLVVRKEDVDTARHHRQQAQQHHAPGCPHQLIQALLKNCSVQPSPHPLTTPRSHTPKTSPLSSYPHPSTHPSPKSTLPYITPPSLPPSRPFLPTPPPFSTHLTPASEFLNYMPIHYLPLPTILTTPIFKHSIIRPQTPKPPSSPPTTLQFTTNPPFSSISACQPTNNLNLRLNFSLEGGYGKEDRVGKGVRIIGYGIGVHQINQMKHWVQPASSDLLLQTIRARKWSYRIDGEREESFEDDLRSLQEYIHSNIQSKRSRIISLYATNITPLDCAPAPTPPPQLAQPSPRRSRRPPHTLQPLAPSPALLASLPQNDANLQFIVSSRFPPKQDKPKPSPLIRWHSPLAKRKQNSTYKSNESKQTAVSDAIDSEKNSHKGDASRRKALNKRAEAVGEGINPWEYLVMAHEQSLCEL